MAIPPRGNESVGATDYRCLIEPLPRLVCSPTRGEDQRTDQARRAQIRASARPPRRGHAAPGGACQCNGMRSLRCAAPSRVQIILDHAGATSLLRLLGSDLENSNPPAYPWSPSVPRRTRHDEPDKRALADSETSSPSSSIAASCSTSIGGPQRGPACAQGVAFELLAGVLREVVCNQADLPSARRLARLAAAETRSEAPSAELPEARTADHCGCSSLTGPRRLDANDAPMAPGSRLARVPQLI